MDYIKKSDLPKINVPIFNDTDNCFKIKKIKFAHNYNDFNNTVINPFKKIIKDEYLSNFIETAEMMFKIIGYGAFVFVLNGDIHTFQVFANTSNIKPGSEKFTKKIIKKINNKTKKNKSFKMYKSIKQWSFSNCMINNGVNWWNKTYLPIYFDMLKTCLKNTDVTTLFFINMFDYPVLYNKNCKQHLNHDIVCVNNNKKENTYIPVLSGATTKNHYDKCMVYADAWELISQKQYARSNEKCSNRYIKTNKINTNWDTKINALIFRGKNNSCYMNDFKHNDRLKTLKAINTIKKNDKLTLNIDVGLNNVSKKNTYTNKLNKSNKDYILKELGETDLKKPISMDEQSNYKYILDIDGYVTPWRICYELQYNSCLLIVRSEYYSWFDDKLEHMKNAYILDVNDENFEKNIEKALFFLQNNSKICKKMANRSLKLYKKIMNLEYVKKYMCSLLTEPEFYMVKKIIP